MSQCAYIIEKTGKQCKRQAEPGSDYCWQHKETVNKQSAKVVKKLPIKDIGQLYFSLLPTDLLIQLFFYFNLNELYSILHDLESIKDFQKIYTSKTFWNDIWKRYISSFIASPENAYEKFKEIISKIQSAPDNSETIIYLAKNGYDIILYSILPAVIDITDNIYYSWAMCGAATGGHIKLITDLIDKGIQKKITYDCALTNAASRGHIGIVKLMLTMGATNYNGAMASAARGGHMDIVKLMLDLGATDYNEAMTQAGYTGNMDIINLMLALGAKSYNKTLASASEGGHMDVINLMLKLGANDFNMALTYAAAGGHIDIIKMMLDLGAKRYANPLISATDENQMEAFEYILNLDNISYNDVIIDVIRYNYDNTIKLILDKIPPSKRKLVNFDYILKETRGTRGTRGRSPTITKLLKSYQKIYESS